jgi:hypothetical protein
MRRKIMNRRATYLFLFIFTIYFSSLSGSPIIGYDANTMPQKHFMYEAHFFYLDYTYRYDYSGEEWIEFPSYHSNVKFGILSEIHYGIFDFVTARLTAPLIFRTIDYGTKETSTGVGDLIVDVKYRIFEGSDALPIISFMGGVRLPTGDSESEVPLGDGSFDVAGGVLIMKKLGSFASHLNGGYWYNGKSESGEQIEDIVFYDVALEYEIAQPLTAIAELNGYYTITGDESEYNYLMEFCPGIINKSFKKLVLEGSVKIPLSSRAVLGYDFTPFIGLKYFF